MKSPLEKRLKLSRTTRGGNSNTKTEHWEPTWAELCEELSEPDIGQKNGTYYIRTQMHEGQRNDKAASTDVQLVIIDGEASYDPGTNEEQTYKDTGKKWCPHTLQEVSDCLREAEIRHVGYTTHSHRDDYNRFRVIIPLKGKARQNWKGAQAHVMDILRAANIYITTVSEMETLGQPWYFPRVPEERKGSFAFVRFDDGAAVTQFVAGQDNDTPPSSSLEAKDQAADRAEHNKRVVVDALKTRKIFSRHDDKWKFLCPWVDEHSEGKEKETGTVYFFPSADNNYMGGFKCNHHHCGGRNIGHLAGKLSVYLMPDTTGWVSTLTDELTNGDTDLTEDGLALRFADQCQNFRWVQPWGRWLRWDGQVWQNDEKLEVFNTARGMIRSVASGSPHTTKTLRKSSTISSVEKLARCDERLAATTDQWDTDHDLLNTQSGIVDLKTGKISQHDPKKHMTQITAAVAVGECSKWLNFLNEVTAGNKELISYLQRVIGYCLSGSVKEHALFFFYGTGRNGKGVFLNTIAAILADYATGLPVEALMETRGDRHPTELAGLMGKRTVIAQEVEEGQKWAEAKIKMLTGGDPITARLMRQDFFTFDPLFKFLISGNHKPALTIDEATRSRFNMIPFTVTIPKEKRDPDLAERLKAEWGGILRWAIDGSIEYNRVGLNPPAVVTSVTNDYFEDQNTMQQWISDCCETGKGFSSASSELFASWKDYAEAARLSVGNNRVFKENLDRAGHPQKRTKEGRYFIGIKVKNNDDDDFLGFDDDFLGFDDD